jgi:peroxiredoxin
MTHPNRRRAFLSLLVGVLLPAVASAALDTDGLIDVGQPAPSFTSTDAQTGALLSFASVYRNQPMVLVFLQTACRSCYREMTTIQRLQQEVGGFGVLGVFLDMTPRNVRKYIEQNGFPFTFTWDADSTIAQAYGVAFTPASFLLDGDRNVVRVYKGFHPGIERALRKDVQELVAER